MVCFIHNSVITYFETDIVPNRIITIKPSFQLKTVNFDKNLENDELIPSANCIPFFRISLFFRTADLNLKVPIDVRSFCRSWFSPQSKWSNFFRTVLRKFKFN